MKILFLDIDGVMVLEVGQGIEQAMCGEASFHKPCVHALNEIVSRTGCETVMSSGWRSFFDLEQMREIFHTNAVAKVPMAFTQEYHRGQEPIPQEKALEIVRCREIMSWLASHDVNARISWCAVDDMDLSIGLGNFVRCPDKNSGLSYRGVVEKVVSILNGTG